MMQTVGASAPAIPAEPDTLLAARLVERCHEHGMIFIARSTARAARVHRAAQALGPGLIVGLLPGWDCLPYDRVSPSAAIMGTRMATLGRLGRPGPHLLVAPVDALMQRLPRPDTEAIVELKTGEMFDADAIRRALQRMGYSFDEDQVDAPGEAALHSAVADIFPADADLPLRIRHDEGRIVEIDRFDPRTQRSRSRVASVVIGPASEVILDDDAERYSGIEHFLPDHARDLCTVFDLLPEADLVLDPEVEELRAQRAAQINDARGAAVSLARTGVGGGKLPPESLYVPETEWRDAVAGRNTTVVHDTDPTSLPRFADEGDDAEETAVAFAADQVEAGVRVGLAGRRIAHAVAEALETEARPVPGWKALLDLHPGEVGVLPHPLAGGFVTDDAVVIADADVFVPRRAASRAELPIDTALRPGDAVVHVEHGIGALRGIETIEAASASDVLCLEYAGAARLLVPADEIDRVWRYGAQAEAVTLDRLDGDAWARRRAEIDVELAATAERLAALTHERAARAAPVMNPPRRAMERFVAGFVFTPTPDQASATDAVLADLRSGRPMDRLVCGDVGFGKTEVALRAAAAAALSGYQVAVLAPTTVLVRQHAATFRRRFARLGIAVEALSRLTGTADAKRIRAGLADGTVRIVIGTQALAGKQVTFEKLGLLVIDEEQRFGVKQKTMLRRLRDGVHTLTLTATPIPRTLQGALAGLQELSVLATPPAVRQPVRTLVLPFDLAVARGAIDRERRRGGQSFVVCPRIEDLAPLSAELRRALPGAVLIEAHGAMKPDDLDEAMLRFAQGEADVLLSTDIIESGLDIARANTMLVWRADLFGLAQLHQLRGRVGRGRVRGAVWLFTDPSEPPGPHALRRLQAIEAQDRLGAGFAIAARDLDLRGAGDLLGDDQAGHVSVVGLDLYQHLLGRALAAVRGEKVPEEWSPEIVLDLPAFAPAEYMPDEAARIDLHQRLSGHAGRRGRDRAASDLHAIEEELADRFGPLPPPVRNLLAMARLRAACRRLGVARLEVGPAAAAATLRGEPRRTEIPGLDLHDGRMILRRATATPEQRLAVAEALLGALAKRPVRSRRVQTAKESEPEALRTVA